MITNFEDDCPSYYHTKDEYWVPFRYGSYFINDLKCSG